MKLRQSATTVYVYDDGKIRNPDNYLAKLNKRIKLQFSNFPKGTIVEIEPPIKQDFTIAHQMDSSVVFVIARDEFDIIEDPITPKLFYAKGLGEGYTYWQEL